MAQRGSSSPQLTAPATLASNSSSSWDGWVESSLEHLRSNHLLRTLRPLVPTGSAVQACVHHSDLNAWVAGEPAADAVGGVRLPAHSSSVAPELRQLRLFSSNDYMGLSTHPRVCQAAADAAMQAGMGPRASALVAGFTHLHRELEQALARLKGTQDCLLFPTGYAANVATVATLAGSPGTIIYSDELNHASIIDGARLAVKAGAQLRVYRHNDMTHLAQLLNAAHPQARKLVVTDSLFSMDGDFADLRGLARLKRQHGFMLAVDEAHATLTCGDSGGGAAELMHVEGQVDVHIGTLSKAFGALGGFVACSSTVRQLLLNRGRNVVFSTALPYPVVAAALAALTVAYSETWRRQHLWALVQRFAGALGVQAHSYIVPLVVGGEAEAMQLSAALLARGFHVPAIRPPTVPKGTSRLRVSLSAAHTVQDVDDLVAALRECGRGVTFQPLQHLARPDPMGPVILPAPAAVTHACIGGVSDTRTAGQAVTPMQIALAVPGTAVQAAVVPVATGADATPLAGPEAGAAEHAAVAAVEGMAAAAVLTAAYTSSSAIARL